MKGRVKIVESEREWLRVGKAGGEQLRVGKAGGKG